MKFTRRNYVKQSCLSDLPLFYNWSILAMKKFKPRPQNRIFEVPFQSFRPAPRCFYMEVPLGCNLVPRTFSLAREKVLGTRLPGLKIFLGVNLRRLCCQERGLSFFKRSVYLVVSPVDNICAAVC